MGVRQYVPALGRFLSVDPIEGGVTNSYDYPADPINKLDLTCEWSWEQTWLTVSIVLLTAATVALAVSVIGTARCCIDRRGSSSAEWFTGCLCRSPSGGAAGVSCNSLCCSCSCATSGLWNSKHGLIRSTARRKHESSHRRQQLGNNGGNYRSQSAALSAVTNYAAKHPNICKRRSLCAAGNHFHVDTYRNGYLWSTRHFYFPR